MSEGIQPVTLKVKLLLLEHGRHSVFAALADAEEEETDVESIERELDALKARKAAKRRTRKVLDELVDELNLAPKHHALVKDIACEYENKRYLPELWRVRQFLETNGIEADRLRSRRAALPSVVKVLGSLPVDKLASLARASTKRTKGDLSVLADQILGARGAPSAADTAK